MPPATGYPPTGSAPGTEPIKPATARGRSWLVAGPRALLALLMAVALSELLLRVLLPEERAFNTFFTPGAHLPDDKYGFVFAPGWHGRMFHDDGVYGVPVSHGPLGFRPTGVTPGPGPRPQVVLLGGASIVYGAGLHDEQALPAVMADHSPCPMTVDEVAWPGFDLQRTYHVYLDRFEPHADPRVVAVMLTGDFLETPLPEALDSVPAALPHDALFHYRADLVVPRPDGVSGAVGRWYYRSYLVARLAQSFDHNGARVRIGWRWLEHIAARLVGARSARPASEAPAGVPSGPPPPDVESRQQRLATFLRMVIRHLRGRGATTMLVFLPVVEPTLGRSAEEEQRSLRRRQRLAELVAGEAQVVDLASRLGGRFPHSGSIALGHYGPAQNRVLGEALAREVCAVLGRGRGAADPQARGDGPNYSE
jgi:hypothetical protein